MLLFTTYDPITRIVIQSGIALDDQHLPAAPDGSLWLYGVRFEPGVKLDAQNQPVPLSGVTTTSVNAERDKRIAAGFVFPPKPDPAAKLFQVNIPNISAAMSSATAATINGSQDGDLRWYDPLSDFTWIAMDNTTLTMDARTMIMFGQTATAFNSSFYTAARAIKNRILAGETLNITDNSLWPAAQVV